MRRSSDPSNLHSPISPTFLAASPPLAPGATPRHRLSAHHSSDSLPPSPRESPPTAHGRPRHVRTNTRIAGRFEVMDLEHSFSEPSALSGNMTPFLSRQMSTESADKPGDSAKEPDSVTSDLNLTEAMTELMSSPAVNVPSKRNDRQFGRFQVSDLSESPPKALGNLSIPIHTNHNIMNSIRRAHSVDNIEAAKHDEEMRKKFGRQSDNLIPTAPTPMPSARASSVVGRFQVVDIIEGVKEGEEVGARLSKNIERGSESSASSSINLSPPRIEIGDDQERKCSGASSPPLTVRETTSCSSETVSFAGAKVDLDKVDTVDLMMILSRRMNSMSEEIKLLREENAKLKQQIRDLTASASQAGENS